MVNGGSSGHIYLRYWKAICLWKYSKREKTSIQNV